MLLWRVSTYPNQRGQHVKTHTFKEYTATTTVKQGAALAALLISWTVTIDRAFVLDNFSQETANIPPLYNTLYFCGGRDAHLHSAALFPQSHRKHGSFSLNWTPATPNPLNNTPRRDEERHGAGIAWPRNGAVRKFDLLQHFSRCCHDQPPSDSSGRREYGRGPKGAVLTAAAYSKLFDNVPVICLVLSFLVG